MRIRVPSRGGLRLLDLVVALGAGISLGLTVGCGSDEPAPGGPSPAEPGATVQPSAPLEGDGHSPQILRVRLTPTEPIPGQTMSAEVDAQDPNGDPITLGYTWRVSGQAVPGGEAKVVLPLSAKKGDAIEVEVRAGDGSALSEPAWGRAVVGNRPPKWVSLQLDPADPVPPGSTLEAVPEVQDPDGDQPRYEYRWYVNGESVAAEGSTFDTTRLHRGDEVYVSAALSDGEDDGEAMDSAPVKIGNADPKIVSAPGSFSADGVFRYTLEVKDPDGDRSLRFRIVNGPPGMRIDPILGEIEWRPDKSHVGKHEVIVGAADTHGGEGQQLFELEVRESGGASPPASP